MSTRSTTLESDDDHGLSALVQEPFFYAALTFDWEVLLPPFVLRVIDGLFPPQYKLSMANKLRLLESSFFVSLLAYTISSIRSV